MKPNYMLIGASKCATSTLCTLLGYHPNVFMVECKETAFFCLDEIYARGFEWYEALYDQAGSKKMRGEGSNRYTMKEIFPETVSRIYNYNPNLKLIYMVRDPIPRIESYWIQKRSHGGEEVHYDFNQAVRLNRDWLVDSSNYWQQINVYRACFPDDRILILFYEDFRRDSVAVLRKCFEFLEVDPDAPLLATDLHLNSSTDKLVLKESLSKLREFYAYQAVVKLIPSRWRELVKQRFFFKKIQSRPQWHPETRNWVADILETDTHKFLEFYGKPKDFWQLRSVGA